MWLSVLLVAASCGLDNTPSDRQAVNSSGTALSWLGDTHLRVANVWLPPSVAPAAGRDLTVYTQTYPIGAAATVELYWANADYSAVEHVAMVPDADGVGTYGNNSQWQGAIPAAAMTGGAQVHYWIRAADTLGNVLYDSRSGADYEVTARRYQVGWIGGLGSYRPINGDYTVGALFNADESTSTGCWNHGVSASSYRARAARVWIPGLTDREWNDQERAAVTAMIRFEVFTDARTEGWSAIPAQFVRREGNDFLYQFRFVSFNPGCVLGLDDGTYEFKLRASTDDGASWLWRGDDAGRNLRVQYAASCSYFNDPFDCIPTGTMLIHTVAVVVQAYRDTPIGATSTFTRELTGTDPPITVANIALSGPDADQFSLQVVDVGTGDYVDPAGPFVLGDGDQLRLVLVHAPTVASPGVLPQQASITWTETDVTGQSRAATGIYLRATTE